MTWSKCKSGPCGQLRNTFRDAVSHEPSICTMHDWDDWHENYKTRHLCFPHRSSKFSSSFFVPSPTPSTNIFCSENHLFTTKRIRTADLLADCSPRNASYDWPCQKVVCPPHPTPLQFCHVYQVFDFLSPSCDLCLTRWRRKLDPNAEQPKYLLPRQA